MTVVLAILLAIFVLPSPWGVVAIGCAAAFEITQTFWSIRWSQRRHAQVGAESLVGVEARIVERCSPYGKAAIRGEIWNARCEGGAEIGETAIVRGLQGLTLLVERKDAAVSEPHSHQRQ
jgi:membrane protein implicated in regulation of membrane protease activity